MEGITVRNCGKVKLELQEQFLVDGIREAPLSERKTYLASWKPVEVAPAVGC